MYVSVMGLCAAYHDDVIFMVRREYPVDCLLIINYLLLYMGHNSRDSYFTNFKVMDIIREK